MSTIKKKLVKLKDNTIALCKESLLIAKENKMLVFYILGVILNGFILRMFTVGIFNMISPIIGDIFITLIFASFYFIFKEKQRFAYLIILSIITTIICIANIVYYNYLKSFMSITFFSFIGSNTETGGANVLGNLLQFKFFIVLWFPIFLIIMKNVLKNKEKQVRTISYKRCFKNIYKWVLIVLILFLTTLKGYDYSRFYSQWNREYLVSKFGVYLYQVNDVIKSIEPRMASLFGSDQANKKTSEYYEKHYLKRSKNDYTNIFKGKNVIAIHAESIQSLAMEQSFNGKEVTPVLNKLAKEGIYFSNFYSQVGLGTSSDTEYTLATSLLPVNVGTAFVNYADREYVTLYKLLKEQGYYTFSMHANTGDFWNRNTMYDALGYDHFYEKASYDINEKIGFGLSDKSFFTQSVEKIKKIASTNEKFYGTLIMLSNHTPFEDLNMYGEFDLTKTIEGKKYPYIEGTKIGDYLKSVRYADEQIGLLINLLKEENLLDNTVIVIYGDHDARIAKSEWNKLYNYDYTTNGVKTPDSEDYIDLDYYWYEINRKVPFIIWSSDKNFQNNYAKEVENVTGMIDVGPTLGNMLGIVNKYSLGHDMIEYKNNIITFPNGNFITDNVYYNDNKSEYKLIKDVPLEEDYISKCKEYSDTLLEVSNNIIVYDFFKKKLSTEKYESER